MKFLKPTCLLILFLFSSCGAYFNQPVDVERATIGEATAATKRLKNLPKAKDKVVVGVYKFRDQTGQYKATETGSTFSTAVTQGATSILIKALEDSKWFIPIERENLGNLLNERNIIRSTRQEYLKNLSPTETQLTPLLYAGVLIEGGMGNQIADYFKKLGENKFSIILTEGKNRQIRRMTEKLGYTVTDLCRIRIQNILLMSSKPNTYREIEGEEKDIFLKSLSL